MSILLDKVKFPSDLKKFSMEELTLLCHEIRDVIISTVSSSGGHLGSSLGAVELIVGLHYCMNAPKDAIIYDVGHQAYTHKLLTGRKDRFHSLRQLNGLSGFPNRFESEYDIFTSGHGSASISTALGLVAARDIEKKSNRVVAVIGDASLGGGMAFEALNHAGHLKKKLLVIVNDNEMSISKSVGALSGYLNRIITAPSYNKIRKDVERLLERVPRFGFRVVRAAKRLEEGLKNLLVPGMLFEEMGFRYFGPIDGNNIRRVIGTLKNISDMEGPVLLHVVTKKGKGYSYAEKVPEKFHGVGSFDVATGKKISGKKEYAPLGGFTDSFSKIIVEQAEKNEKIIAITAAMPEGTGLDIFSKAYPDRFFDVGMAEQHAVGFAAGLAGGGLKPVAAIYSTFLQRSYDQIIHDVCLQKLNVTFMIDRAGLVGEDGPTHHGVFDMAYLGNLPNMVAMAPKDEKELSEMFKFAMSYREGPIAIRYPRGKSFGPYEASGIETSKIELGKSEVLRKGKDLTIVAIGYMTLVCLEAAEELSREGIDCEVINGRFIRPIGQGPILDSVSRTGRMLTAEEGVLLGGFGSLVRKCVVDKLQKGIIMKSIGLPDKFVEHGARNVLLGSCGLSPDKIKQTIKSLVWQK